jgi:aspartyl-tRNA(Asn)/glutamyl-tRNA(Gln) amidotransferase subunit C
MDMEDLRETAALAHLNLDEKELSGAFSAFEQMLGYFAAMEAADREAASPDVGPAAGISAVARTVSSPHFRPDDQPLGSPGGEEVISRMLDSAAERDGRFVVVPNVL